MNKQIAEITKPSTNLIAETTIAARKLFKGLPIKVWYIKLGENAWRCFVINTDNKVKLMSGPIRKTPETALSAAKGQLESIVGKSSKTSQ